MCIRDSVKTVLAQIDEETSLLVREGATQEAFDMAKAQLKGGFILGQESAYNRDVYKRQLHIFPG